MSADMDSIAPHITCRHDPFKLQQNRFTLPILTYPEKLLIAADKLAFRFIEAVVWKDFVSMRQIHPGILRRIGGTARIGGGKRRLVKPAVIKRDSFFQFSSLPRRHRIAGVCGIG